MLSFNLTLPTSITTAALTESPESTAPGYQEGFQSGYKAGQWKAQLEAEQQLAEIRKQFAAQLKALHTVHETLDQTAGKHLPELLSLTLQRLFRKHPFTAEETAKELASILQELSEAQSITIECHPKHLSDLQSFVKSESLTMGNDHFIWKESPDLNAGEFKIQSDLGTYDGRHLIKLSKVQTVLEDRS